MGKGQGSKEREFGRIAAWGRVGHAALRVSGEDGEGGTTRSVGQESCAEAFIFSDTCRQPTADRSPPPQSTPDVYIAYGAVFMSSRAPF